MLERAIGDWTREDARHLLNRAGFGGSPADVAELYGMGREAAVEVLVNPGENLGKFPMPEWADAETMRKARKEFFKTKAELKEKSAELGVEEADKLLRNFQNDAQRERRKQGVEAQGWWFRRMLKTEAPLREKMVLFWHDHFPSSMQKVRFPALLMKQNALFREYATGNFRELTGKVVTDPAMMLYLDAQRSTKAQPNENFARELMELFTLGEGNYSEEDVKEVARAFTGYRIDQVTGEVAVKKFAKDDGEKVIFGMRGHFDGPDVVEMIFGKRQCADFLVKKLWEYFCYEAPERQLVTKLAEVFREGGFEVTPVLREIFLSREFYGKKAVGGQIKSPVQYLVQMLKELEMSEAPGGLPMIGQKSLGQELFMPPNVAGWDWGKAWVNTNTLLTRYNLAGRVTKGNFGKEMDGGRQKKQSGGRKEEKPAGGIVPNYRKIAGEAKRKDAGVLVDELMERFFNIPVSAAARQTFMDYAVEKMGGDFTDKELGELCHLMMSTPYYQLC
eukprot:g3901.t1